MPEVDGLEATRQIRTDQANAGLPVIAMTANAMKSDVDACLKAGMNDFLSKPIDRLQLVRTLRRWLTRVAGDKSAAPEPPRPADGDGSLPQLQGIDIAGTVRRLGLPFEKLRPLVLRFADSQRQTLDDLRAAVKRADANGAGGHAHALAGAAGNLGATQLHEAAKALEAAARTGRTDLADLFNAVEQAATTAFNAIETLRPNVRRVAEAPSPGRPVDADRLRTALEKLRGALIDFDLSGSYAALAELTAPDLPIAIRSVLGDLRRLVEEYEYDEAAAAVTRLLQDFAPGERQ
jgi:HPt (histidine-containing phosphotransfer) domain-containing protein